MPVIRYDIHASAGAESSPGDAHAEHYTLVFWRGEREVEYTSTTGRDTCDSGAWQAAAWLFGLLLPLWAGLVWLGLRRRAPR